MNRSSFVKTMLPLLLVVLAMNLMVTGCGKKETPTPTPTKTATPVPILMTPTPTVTFTPQPPTPTPTPTQKVEAAEATPTSTPTEEKPVLIEMTNDINPLTGLKTDPAKLNRRPLAVKIANFPESARPQAGISFADVMFEYEAEAYVTRFTAIFLSEEASLLGPIRSLRLPDAEVVPIFKAALVGSGGHPAVKIRMTEGKPWAEGDKRIICPEDPYKDDGAMRRIEGKKPLVELTMYSDTATLWNVLTLRGINERQNFYNMFVFSNEPPAGGKDATKLKIVYKPTYAEVEYQYDAESKTYKRSDLDKPLVDEVNGQQIAPSNVVVIYVNHVDTDIPADTHDVNQTWFAVSIQLWGQGPAKILRDGKVYDATWIRENPQQDNDRLILVDGKGNQIPFHPGKTWVQLVRLDGNAKIE